MLNKLYFWLGHWLMDSLPKVDDSHIKCATCGWESEHINSLKFIYIGDNKMEGLCPKCYGKCMYYKKDYGELKAKPLPTEYTICFKEDEDMLQW